MRLLVVTFACIILAATEAGASVYKGKVKDAKTGEELIGATIFIKEYPNIGSTTGRLHDRLRRFFHHRQCAGKQKHYNCM